MTSSNPITTDPHCIFCAIVAGRQRAEKIYEDDRTVAFLDINPVNTGHSLVIPKAHVEYIYGLGDDDAAAVMQVAVRVARALKTAFQPEGVNLLQSNERAAGQAVFHFHIHVIPRWYGDGLITPRHAPRRSSEPLDQVAAKIRAVIID
jgi:histidine triad (HIT) family protein